MYNLIILINNPPANFQLAYKTEEAGKAAREKAKAAYKAGSYLTLTDDYGQVWDVEGSLIVSIFLQCNQGKCEIADDQTIDQAKNNANFQQRRNNDMELMRLFPGNAQHQLGRA